MKIIKTWFKVELEISPEEAHRWREGLMAAWFDGLLYKLFKIK